MERRLRAARHRSRPLERRRCLHELEEGGTRRGRDKKRERLCRGTTPNLLHMTESRVVVVFFNSLIMPHVTS